jgi:hypothetical protein
VDSIGGALCPNCGRSFETLDDLYTHALHDHKTTTLANLIGDNQMAKELFKKDFTQVDSHWVCAIDSFHLSLMPNAEGEFRLSVYGAFAPIPPATTYPTEPEWDKALQLANKFLKAYTMATEDDKHN